MLREGTPDSTGISLSPDLQDEPWGRWKSLKTKNISASYDLPVSHSNCLRSLALMFEYSRSSGSLLQMQSNGHWSKVYPSICKLPWLCPRCQQEGYWLFPDSLQCGDIRPRSAFNWPLRSGHGQLRGTLILCPTITISDRELWVVIVVSEWLMSFLLDTGVTFLVPNRVCSYSRLSTRKETLPKSLQRLQVCLSYPSLTHSHLEEV